MIMMPLKPLIKIKIVCGAQARGLLKGVHPRFNNPDALVLPLSRWIVSHCVRNHIKICFDGRSAVTTTQTCLRGCFSTEEVPNHCLKKTFNVFLMQLLQIYTPPCCSLINSVTSAADDLRNSCSWEDVKAEKCFNMVLVLGSGSTAWSIIIITTTMIIIVIIIIIIIMCILLLMCLPAAFKEKLFCLFVLVFEQLL